MIFFHFSFKYHFRIQLCCVALVFSCLNAYEQPRQYKHISVNDGLAGSTVYHFLQDRYGYVWLATENGVNRYDGSTFESFTTANGLPDNEVLYLREDSKGRIWFLLFNGQIAYYENGIIFNSSNCELLKEPSKGSYVGNMFEDSQGTLFFFKSDRLIQIKGLQAQTVYYADFFHPNDIENYFFFEDSKNIQHTIIRGIPLRIENRKLIHEESTFKPKQYGYMVKSGHECNFFPAPEGIVEVNSNGQKLVFPSRIIPHYESSSYFEIDNENNLWVCTFGYGAYRYSNFPDTNSLPESFLPGKIVNAVMQDRQENNVWFSVKGEGIYLLSRNYPFVYSYSQNDSLIQDNIYSVVTDKDKNIWLGFNHGIVQKIKPSGEVQTLDVNYKQESQNRVLQFFPDQNNVLWCVTDRGLVLIYPDTGGNYIIKRKYFNYYTENGSYAIKDIAQDLHGNYSFCSSKGIFSFDKANDCLTRPNVFSSVRTFSHLYDLKNTLWVSTTQGVYSASLNDTMNWGSIYPLLKNRMNSISMMHDGTLVFTSNGFGIVFFKDGKIISHLTMKNGLAGDIVKRIVIAGDYCIAATTNGLSIIRFRESKLEARNFTASDGLLSNEVNDVCYDGNRVLAATSGGLSVLKINPESWIRYGAKMFSLKHDSSSVPQCKLYLVGITAGDSDITNIKNPQLTFNNNNLKFRFSVPAFYYPSKTIYEYTLNWGNITKANIMNPELNFAELAPGDYKLSVRAKTELGSWSLPLNFEFTIIPPLWKRLWFRIIAVFILIMIFALLVYRRSRIKQMQQMKDNALRLKMIQAEQQATQALMNPHFIFNVMNSIYDFGKKHGQQEADAYLADFASLVRLTMKNLRKRYIELEDELEYLGLYLKLEQRRLGEKLSFSINIDQGFDSDGVQVPAMILQPFVENAVVHGIQPLKRNGEIRINVSERDENYFIVSIMDDGVGFNSSNNHDSPLLQHHESSAMELTRSRLQKMQELSGKIFSLNIREFQKDDSPFQCGTLVEIVMPCDVADLKEVL